jgi:hypothetical protein
MSLADTMADEWALRRLTYLYARAMDRNEPDTLRDIFSADAVIESPVAVQTGIDEILAVPPMLGKMFASTMHTVLNQTVEIDGDSATGETYGVAYQLKKPKDGAHERLDWGIRYQDQFVRSRGRWQFIRRTLIIEWTQTVPVDLIAKR